MSDKGPTHVIDPDGVAKARIHLHETEFEDVVGAGSADYARFPGGRCVVAPGNLAWDDQVLNPTLWRLRVVQLRDGEKYDGLTERKENGQ